MKLRKVSATNFMGATFKVCLDDLNLIVGPNDSGKTRLRNAITLLLLGYLPSLDKKPAAIFKLSSGRKMEVEGLFDNGEMIHRSWEMKGESVKAAHHVPDSFDAKTPMILLDAGDYFSRSARGRVEMVFAVAKIEAPDVIVTVTEVLASDCGRDFTNELLKETLSVGGQSAPTQEWLEALLTAAESQRSNAAAEVKRYAGTLQGVTALQLAEKAPLRDVDEIDREIDKLQAVVSKNREELSALKREQEQGEVNDLERQRLTGLLKGAPKIKDFDVEELRRSEKAIQQNIAHEESKKAQHGLWKQRVEYRDTETARLTAELRTLEAEKIDDKPDVCETCERPFDDPQSVQASIAGRLRKKGIAIAGKRQQITNLTAGKTWDEPPRPQDTTTLEADLKAVRADLDAYAKNAVTVGWRSQLEALPQTRNVGPEIVEVETAIIAKTSHLENLRAERRTAESERADRKRLAEAQTKKEEAEQNETRAKEAKKFLLEKKSELIVQVFGPLLDMANKLMDGIFSSPIEYRDGELGVFNESSWVTEETFGGAKRALLYAALQAALGVQSPCRILMMDELGTVDDDNFITLVGNIAMAQKTGAFEQFIGLRPGIPEWTAKAAQQNGYALTEATGKGYAVR